MYFTWDLLHTAGGRYINLSSFISRAMLTANLSTLTPHSSLVFEEDNSTDSENGTSDEIDGEKKELVEENAVFEDNSEREGATASPEPG
jgi:hypothetical protein